MHGGGHQHRALRHHRAGDPGGGDVARPGRARARLGDECWLVYHGHDTWGQGIANGRAALAAGADTVDGALGGLGGCPFAPGASGNTATEDLLYAIRPDWLTPAHFRALVTAGREVLAAVGEPQHSAGGGIGGSTTGPQTWGLGER